MLIRDAVSDDAPELAVLMSQLGYETNRTEMEMRLKLVLSNPATGPLSRLWMAAFAGWSGRSRIQAINITTYGRILALVTLSAVRRRGIGRALIATAEKDFAQRGIKRVALDARLTREDAHGFYESLGYERNVWRFVKQLPVSD
jgi:ribosomal protein S18 acetylase RimI-like enzyme